VLADPIQRKIYDKVGRDGVQVNDFGIDFPIHIMNPGQCYSNLNLTDATALFARIFGGGSFAPWYVVYIMKKYNVLTYIF
jgi:DnaJ-class molecular chaperone